MSQIGTIGIVGGGQLARMMTEAAAGIGLSVVVIDPTPNCPAKQVGAEQIEASMHDIDGLHELANRADVITIDVEHVDADTLTIIAAAGKPVRPLPATIKMIQDKFEQKKYLSSKGISVADFVEIKSLDDALKAIADFSGKMLIKTRLGAFDGRGNSVVSNDAEIKEALELFEGKDLYAEKFVPFKKELAVMLARDLEGNISVYPVVETIQSRNICEYVIAPARIDQASYQKAERLAHTVAESLEGPGIYGIEMFLTQDGEVIVNEIAPRVHNSGHYTIESNKTSQFEQHLRAVSGMPLGSSELKVKAACMVNILGKRDGPTEPTGFDKLEQIPHTYVHLYGKSPTKVDRKMGHITVTADDTETAYANAKKAIDLISI